MLRHRSHDFSWAAGNHFKAYAAMLVTLDETYNMMASQIRKIVSETGKGTKYLKDLDTQFLSALAGSSIRHPSSCFTCLISKAYYVRCLYSSYEHEYQHM